MSGKAEKLQDAIGMVADEYILEAHGEEAPVAGEPAEGAGAETAAETGAGVAKPVKADPQNPRKRRGRRVALPVALAACLAIVLGVGALALTDMSASMVAYDLHESASELAEGESTPRAVSEEARVGAVGAASADAIASTALAPGRPGGDWGDIDSGAAFVLTAAEWNDNANWPFFTNLVNAGKIAFPSFGIDPRHRVRVEVVDESGAAVRGQQVTLLDGAGNELWRAVSGRDGIAYLFYRDGESPARASAAGVTQELMGVGVADGNGQRLDDGTIVMGDPVSWIEDVTLVLPSAADANAGAGGLQVMFIVDTTGSMADEIAYLQKDFISIASDVGSDGVSYSVNFYRDEGDDYVTKRNDFTSDVKTVQGLLAAEYADGGGDEPEAVADILAETITGNDQWRDDCSKVAFLIFDAPPHEDTDAVLDAAVRSAAERGIRMVPVVASNASRATELFGRALAICTNGTYVFLTDDSGVGDAHLEPIVGDYTVELLHDIIVRIIEESR